MRRGRIISAVWLIGAATALGVQSPVTGAAQSSVAEMVTHPISVSRFHRLSDFKNDDAEAILEEMSRILQSDDGTSAAPDVECAVEFSLDGQVGTFMVGNGEISNKAEFLEVVGEPGTVKVVFQVNWCFDADDAPDPVNLVNYGACADTSTGSFVVEGGLKTDLAGVLWSHEFGHLQSLGHRVDEPFMVMNRIVGPESRRVDTYECDRFRQ